MKFKQPDSDVFISYAQNHEDLMVWRALGRVEFGTYVDVGASSPSYDSVTRALYERGWRGINIEPTTSSYLELLRYRPEDVNVQAVVGPTARMTTLYEVDGGGGLSTVVPSVAQRYSRPESHWHVREVPVMQLPLDQVLDRFLGSRDVHFLKIDVEGFESSVLDSLSLDKYAPWLLCIESTYPLTRRSVASEWEPSLLGQGYARVFFDGSNTWYLREDKLDELGPHFDYPPSAPEKFVRTRDLTQAFREGLLHEFLGSPGASGSTPGSDQLLRELDAVYSSRSWRMTAPLRNVRQLVRSKLGL